MFLSDYVFGTIGVAPVLFLPSCILCTNFASAVVHGDNGYQEFACCSHCSFLRSLDKATVSMSGCRLEGLLFDSLVIISASKYGLRTTCMRTMWATSQTCRFSGPQRLTLKSQTGLNAEMCPCYSF